MKKSIILLMLILLLAGCVTTNNDSSTQSYKDSIEQSTPQPKPEESASDTSDPTSTDDGTKTDDNAIVYDGDLSNAIKFFTQYIGADISKFQDEVGTTKIANPVKDKMLYVYFFIIKDNRYRTTVQTDADGTEINSIALECWPDTDEITHDIYDSFNKTLEDIYGEPLNIDSYRYRDWLDKNLSVIITTHYDDRRFEYTIDYGAQIYFLKSENYQRQYLLKDNDN